MVLKDKWKIILNQYQDLYRIGLFFIFILLVIFVFNLLAISKKSHYEINYFELENLLKQNNTEEKQKKYFETLNKKTPITFWHNFETKEEDILKNKIIKKFQEKYPNIEVISQNKGNWNEIFKNVSHSLPANKQPNLVVSYPDHLITYSKTNKVVPLDIFIKYDAEAKRKIENNFLPGFLEKITNLKQDIKTQSFEDKPKYYYLPFMKTTEVVFYNMNIFKKIQDDEELKNIINSEGKIQKNRLNWEDIRKIAKKIKSDKKYKDILPIMIDSETNLFIISANQINQNYPSESEEVRTFLQQKHNRQIMEYFKKNFFDQKFLTTFKLSQENNIAELFRKEKIGMYITSTRRIDKIHETDFPIGIIETPIYNKENEENYKNTNILQGSNINLFYVPNKNEMLASWLFLQYLTSNETYENLIKEKDGTLIPTKYLKEKFHLEEEKNKNEQKSLKNESFQFILNISKILEQENKEFYFFFNNSFEKSSLLRIIINELFTEVLILPKNDPNLENKIAKLFENAIKRFETI